MGSNIDGKLDTLPVAKAASPFQRLIGTEVSAKDFRIAEDGGLVKIQENTGSEGAPTWTTRLSLVLSATGELLLESGDLAWKSGTAFKGILAHGNSAARTYTFQNKDGTVAYVGDNDSFAPGTRQVFDQDTAPVGWTRDASVDDRVMNIQGVGNREHAGSWLISGLVVASHTHDMGNHIHGIPHTHTVPRTGWGSVVTGVSVIGRLRVGDGSTDPTPPEAANDVASGGSSAPNSAGPSTNTSGAAAPGVNSDGNWRPLHRSVILCSKN